MKTAESLQIMEEMIATAKKDISDDGFLYLVWGYLVFGASLLHFFLLGKTEWHWVGWPILMTTGGITTGIYLSRTIKESKVKTYLDKVFSYLWGAFSISILLVLIVGGSIEFGGEIRFTYAFVLVLYAIGTFVSGGVLNFRPLILGGLLCWVCAGVCFFVTFKYQLLLLALAVLVAYIIPGHMLKAKYQ